VGVEQACAFRGGARGERLGHTLRWETGRDCNDVQPAAIPCGDWDLKAGPKDQGDQQAGRESLGRDEVPNGCLSPCPVVVPRRQTYLMLRTWSVMTRSPFLVWYGVWLIPICFYFFCMSRPHCDLPQMLRLPHLQTVISKFTIHELHTVLL
jgi:hypothetical protein